MINSLQDILSIEDRKTVSYHVKEWQSDVNIRPLTSEQAEKITVRFSGLADDKDSMVGMRTSLVRLSLVDSGGSLIIKNDQEAKQLGEKSSAAMKEIFEFCMELNGFNTKAEDEEKN